MLTDRDDHGHGGVLGRRLLAGRLRSKVHSQQDRRNHDDEHADQQLRFVLEPYPLVARHAAVHIGVPIRINLGGAAFVVVHMHRHISVPLVIHVAANVHAAPAASENHAEIVQF